MLLGHTGFGLENRYLNLNAAGKNFVAESLGKGSYVSTAFYENVDLRNHVLIGNYCSIAAATHFLIGMNHDYRKGTTFPFDYPSILTNFQTRYPDVDTFSIGGGTEFYRDPNLRQIIIGNDVWIGTKVTIIGGAKIGNGAVIGSGAVVAKNIPPYAIAVGNPVRVVKYRFDEETIKKFMAVKWWSWDLKKLFQNAELLYQPEKFLAKHYSPELEKISADKMSSNLPIEKYKASGMKIFSFVADFEAVNPLWRRVFSGFCQSTLQNSVLIFGVGEGFNQEHLNYMKKIADNSDLSSKVIHVVHLQGEKILSPYILTNSTHFITTRELTSIDCLDWIWGTDVKILSALDEAIFEGEQPVDWEGINLS